MSKPTFYVREDGNVSYLDNDTDDTLKEMGPAITKRASFCRPNNPWLKLVFMLLRTVSGDKGKIADWTRTWNCQWFVDMSPSGGPGCLGIYDTREEALAQEAQWLRVHLYGGCCELGCQSHTAGDSKLCLRHLAYRAVENRESLKGGEDA